MRNQFQDPEICSEEGKNPYGFGREFPQEDTHPTESISHDELSQLH